MIRQVLLFCFVFAAALTAHAWTEHEEETFAFVPAPVNDRAFVNRCARAFGMNPSTALTYERVGMQTVQNAYYRPVNTVFLPLPKNRNEEPTNLNARGFEQYLPRKFVISDGMVRDAFIRVDNRPGSPLNNIIKQMAQVVSRNHPDTESLLAELKTFTYKYLQPVPSGYRFPWSPKVRPDIPRGFEELAKLPAGHTPVATDLMQPTVPLEFFLEDGHGYCLHRSLFTSLILQELRIPNRIQTGGIQGGDAGGGHTWIDLPNDRILDPTLSALATTNEIGAQPGWFFFSGGFRYRNFVNPIVIEEE